MNTRDQIALAYMADTWWYDVRGLFILPFAYKSTLQAQLVFLGPNFGPRHLEAACGTGKLLELFLKWRRWKKLPAELMVGATTLNRCWPAPATASPRTRAGVRARPLGRDAFRRCQFRHSQHR